MLPDVVRFCRQRLRVIVCDEGARGRDDGTVQTREEPAAGVEGPVCSEWWPGAELNQPYADLQSTIQDAVSAWRRCEIFLRMAARRMTLLRSSTRVLLESGVQCFRDSAR